MQVRIVRDRLGHSVFLKVMSCKPTSSKIGPAETHLRPISSATSIASTLPGTDFIYQESIVRFHSSLHEDLWNSAKPEPGAVFVFHLRVL